MEQEEGRKEETPVRGLFLKSRRERGPHYGCNVGRRARWRKRELQRNILNLASDWLLER